ncbi:MAG: Z1 domain-containing protein [Desulfuromonadaceae bacterium]
MMDFKPDPYELALAYLKDNQLTEEVLESIIKALESKFDFDENELNAVRRKLETDIGITMTVGDWLHGEGQEPWVEDQRANITWAYWDAYKKYLQKTSRMNLEVVRVLDEDTDHILNECGNPSLEHGWKIRGLVMGDVQSGKTANYSGLINKAADAGYKVIVLLTGMIEELRSQTQERLDEGFVGQDSNILLDDGTRKKLPFGVGRFRSKIPIVMTSVSSDFLTSNARTLRGVPLKSVSEPVLLVMKKNKSPLQNLVTFLDSQLLHDAKQLELPLLLIDDEADNASVNSKKDEDPAMINSLIRKVLDRFTRSTYVAYTATPFANVFINPDTENDLFPANFVYSLNTPTNYIGASSIFSENGSHSYQLKDIYDADPVIAYKHNKNHVIESLPLSLETAVQTFLLSCAIRDLRKEPLRHRSMLVNVTRFTDVQHRISTLLKQYLYELTEEIKQYLADDEIWIKHVPLKILYEVWQEQFAGAGYSWEQIRKTLHDSVASVKVLTINQKTDTADRLDYKSYKNTDKGRRVIAVGGLTLSRGLTLEGLCVSYFYRNSKAYDTLLQMGRWFGYRTGYDDLCRIWMDPDVQEWFEHIAGVVSELRWDIKRMHANQLRPKDFGMRVRSHPDTLIVTAINKMRNSKEIEHSVSYSGKGAETPILPKSEDVNKTNISVLSQFIAKLAPAQPAGNRYIWKGVSSSEIASLLSALTILNMNIAFIPDLSGKERPLIKFISENKINNLEDWDICLPQGEGTKVPGLSVTLADGSIGSVSCRERQFEKVKSGCDYLRINKQRVGEISDEKIGIEKHVLSEAKKEWDKLHLKEPLKYKKTVPGWFYRTYRDKPLLTIHVIQPKDSPDSDKKIMKANDIDSKTLLAVSLSFPEFEDDEKSRVFYQLNKVALRNLGLIDDESEESDDDED